MAEDEDNQQGQGEGLKYLGFVQDAATYAVTTFSNVYLFAKDKSGPLQPGVDIIEGPVKNVAVPLYNRFSYIPNGALKFVDSTVVASVTIIDRSLPPIVKDASIQVVSAIRAASEAARSLASSLPGQTKILAKVFYGEN
uniref:Rubber elongation factor n=1 Tax=Hevea brasiliensis TaxID=3981 RepID=W0JBG5_HEVBR|nr:rubber elongation factor [Hevea brasiliensis]